MTSSLGHLFEGEVLAYPDFSVHGCSRVGLCVRNLEKSVFYQEAEQENVLNLRVSWHREMFPVQIYFQVRCFLFFLHRFLMNGHWNP